MDDFQRAPRSRPAFRAGRERGFAQREPAARRAVGPPAGSETWRAPWVQMKYVSFHPCIYPAMILGASPDTAPGGLVNVYDKDGQPFGTGHFNPRARVPLRMLHQGAEPVGEEFFVELLGRALALRLDVHKLPESGDTFRVVNSDGDGLGGLVVDKFADVLVAEPHSLGMFLRLRQWLPMFHERLGTKRTVVAVDPDIARIEGIRAADLPGDEVRAVRVTEHGVKFEVNFAAGHKTGFFCDQRENRRRFAALANGARVLDLCCYTGGFAIAAALAGAKETVGVDLDEKSIAQARRNANLNQLSAARSTWTHCDAFSYARQMQRNGEQFDAVVVDPPKFLTSRETADEDRWRYDDLNALAMSITRPGGVFATCSCSGLLSAEEFEAIVCRAAHRLSRRLQIFDRTGAGVDHPMMSNCPEGRYLKVIWGRVW